MTAAENRPVPTVAAMLRVRADDDNVGLVFEGRSWTWREIVAQAAVRAAWMRATLDPDRPPHIGVLLPNLPEFVFQIFGAALAGACIVGVNSTRRGAELARDIAHTSCQLVISDATLGDLADDSVRVEDAPWAAFDGAAMPEVDPSPSSLLFLLLTSGSTSAPKAAKCSQARLAGVAAELSFGPKAVLYCPLTLAHGNALNSCLFPALANGCRLVLRDRFSAGAWLDDIRSSGATFTTTVGRALGYILATPPGPHDRDHRLRAVLAPEASPRDTAEFHDRFGVRVMSGYGSSEGGIALVPAGKPGSLGIAPAGADIAVVNDAGVECEPAQFDSDGKLCNATAATGELVRRDAGGSFEGYWNNPEAQSERLRDGFFWSGDLAYRDSEGVFWFAGRVGDWLRVDSENFAVSPVERIVGRFADAAAVAVVGVPDPLAGDQALVAIELRPERSFDPAAFASFLDAQPDLGTKWAPRFVRVMPELPVISQGKIDKKPLRREAWLCDDPVWWRPARSAAYLLMSSADRDRLRDEFLAHGRIGAYPQPSPKTPEKL
jgi:fatty-acyl-CoA synthase